MGGGYCYIFIVCCAIYNGLANNIWIYGCFMNFWGVELFVLCIK